MDPGRRRLGMAAVAMGLAALLLTFSRASWLAILLGGVTMLLVAPGRRAMPNARARLRVTVAAFNLVFFALLRIPRLGPLSEHKPHPARALYHSVAHAGLSPARTVPDR